MQAESAALSLHIRFLRQRRAERGASMLYFTPQGQPADEEMR